MRCEACGEAQYRSNLSVVRIWARRVTKQIALISPLLGLSEKDRISP